MRKTLCLVCAVLCLLSALSVPAFADGTEMYDDAAALPVGSDAAAAILIEYESGDVLFEMEADKRLPMASVTKIMTLILAFEAESRGDISLDEKVRISKTAADMTGSEAFLDYNGEYTVSDLLRTVIVVSANDSCVALAELIAGSEADFVDRMNARADELGLTNTHFSDCTGLSDRDHYSSARDIAAMSKVLLGYGHYFDYSKIWTDTLVHPGGRVTDLSNTNKLIRFYSGADGVKTGYTSAAKYCLSASACRGGMRFITVVLGSATSEKRFETAKGLLNYGFATYTRTKLFTKGTEVENALHISGARSARVRTVLEDDVFLMSRKGESVNYDMSIEWKDGLTAPLAAGSTVGTMKITVDGRVAAEGNIVLCDAVEKANFGDGFLSVVRAWLRKAG